jgi:hypothetical protein
MPGRRQRAPSHPIEIEVDGKRFEGRYSVESGVITVWTVLHGREATQLGGSSPERLARILLHELVAKSKNR